MATAAIRRFSEALTDGRLPRSRYCPHSNESGRAAKPGKEKGPAVSRRTLVSSTIRKGAKVFRLRPLYLVPTWNSTIAHQTPFSTLTVMSLSIATMVPSVLV